MDTIEVIKNGYEIVIKVTKNITNNGMIEADAYYKDFDFYKILVIADSTDKAVKLATQELLMNHPFEKVIREN